MKHQLSLTAVVFLLFLSSSTFSQSVGIGTETPNSNAILELVAPDNNQGLLVPRMTTEERTADTFISNLSVSDNGLMVYDEDQNKFFFWIVDQWVELATGNLSGLPDQVGQEGKVLSTNGSTALWTELDFSSLSNVPSGIEDGDDDTQLSDSDIQNLGYIKNADDADSDPNNENQTVSAGTGISVIQTGEDFQVINDEPDQTISLVDGGSGNVTIGGTYPNLSIDVVNPSANEIAVTSTTNLSSTNVQDALEELQEEITSAASSAIVDGSVTTPKLENLAVTNQKINDVDFSKLTSVPSGLSDGDDVDDADSDPTNENQTVSAGTGVSITQSGNDFEVTNTSPDQTVTLTDGGNGNVTIGGTYPNLTIDIPDNIDNSITNEIQDISTNGNPGDITISDGSTLSVNVDDADSDSANELQDLSLSGSTLSLSNSSATVDLAPFSGTNTDNQMISLSGDDLSISGGNTIDISSINTNLSESDVDGFVGNNGYLTTEADGSTTNELNTGMSLVGTTIRVTDAGGTEEINIGGTFATDAELAASDAADGDKSDSNEIQNISTSGAAGNISLSDGSTLNLNVNDADASTTNELNTGMSLVGTTIRVTDAGGTEGINIGGTFATDSELAASDAADGDKSASNEFQSISKSGTTLTLSNGGGSVSVADNDNSSSNEYNSSMSLSGTSIRVTDGGGTRSVNIGGTFATDSELDSRTFSPDAFKATPKAGGGTIPIGNSVLSFDTEVYDLNGSYDGSSTFTTPEDGLYNMGGLLLFSNVPTGLVQIILVDTDLNVLYSKAYAPGTIQSSIAFSTDLSLKSGETVTVRISNTTLGGNEATAINTSSAGDGSNFFFCGKRFN